MQLQLTGTLAGIEARNGGWFGISFMEQGAQYPKKLSTKRPELVQQCQQMMGQVVTASYNEQESTNINPNSGTPYMNRYLEAISLPGQMPQPVQQPQQWSGGPGGGVPVPQQQSQQFQGQPVTFAQQPAAQPFTPPVPAAIPQAQVRVSDDLREARIMRQSAAKVAVDLLAHLDPPDRNLASLIRISEQLTQYFRDGVQWSVPPVQEQAPQQHQGPPPAEYAHSDQGAGWPAPDNDDDIPF